MTEFSVMNKSGQVTKTHEIDLSKIKSTDPLAYAFGFVEGERGNKLSKEKNLASEYVRGWKEGHKNYIKKLREVV